MNTHLWAAKIQLLWAVFFAAKSLTLCSGYVSNTNNRKSNSFAALKIDGSVITWGRAIGGGDSSAVASSLSSGVEDVYSNGGTFAALKSDRTVITWGGEVDIDIDITIVAPELLRGVEVMYSTRDAFAAWKGDGSVITWGVSDKGGDSSAVASSLSSGVEVVYTTSSAFAALKTDGSVITWGDSASGGDSSAVAASLSSGVKAVYAAGSAFAALKTDGSVVTWGNSLWGGDSTAVASSLLSAVEVVYSTQYAFTALKTDGSAIVWGRSLWGGDSSAVTSSLSNGVRTVYSTATAFAALKTDGSVITWGESFSGGDSSAVAASLSSGVKTVFATGSAFAALKTDGSLIVWGDARYGGDTVVVASSLSSGVEVVYSTKTAFAALKTDGSVITWGESESGGDSSAVAASLSSGVKTVYANNFAFAALKTDGSVITWGNSEVGGDSSTASSGLSSGVARVYGTRGFLSDSAIDTLRLDGNFTSRITCPPFSSRLGIYNTTTTSCTCKDGYTEKRGTSGFDTSCVQCAKGYTSVAGSVCHGCPVSTYWVDTNECVKCPSGRVTPSTGTPDIDGCLNPAPNFVSGTFALAAMVLIAFFYLANGRFSLVAAARKLGYVMPFVEACRIRARILYIPIVLRKKNLRFSSRTKVFLFFIWGLLGIVFISFFYYVSTVYAVIINSVILWRGLRYKYPIDIIDQIELFISQIGIMLHVPMLKYIFYPAVYVVETLGLIHINYEGLNVTCLGSQASVAMLINMLICGVVIIFIESDYSLFWVSTAQSLHKSTIQKLAKSLLKRPTLGAKLRTVCAIMTVGIVTIIASPFQVILRYVVGFVDTQSFQKVFSAGGGVTPACNNVAGVKGIDSAMKITSSLVYYWMLLPILFAISNIFLPGCHEIVLKRMKQRGVDIVGSSVVGIGFLDGSNAKHKHVESDVFESKLKNILINWWYKVSPDLPMADLGRRWTEYLLRLSTIFSSERALLRNGSHSSTMDLRLTSSTTTFSSDNLTMMSSNTGRDTSSISNASHLPSLMVFESQRNTLRSIQSCRHRYIRKAVEVKEAATESSDGGVEPDTEAPFTVNVRPNEYDLKSTVGATAASASVYVEDELCEDEDEDDLTAKASSANSERHTLEAVTIRTYFPSYFELCALETNEMVHTLVNWFEYLLKDSTKAYNIISVSKDKATFAYKLCHAAVRVLCTVIVYVLHLGHFCTVVGREHLRCVLWKYFKFISVCLGWWDAGNESTDTMMDITGIMEFHRMPRTFNIYDVYRHQRLHSDTTDALYAIIGNKAILFMMYSNLTIASVYFVLTCGSPLFVFSKILSEKFLPPLYFPNALEVAKEQENKIMEHLYHSESRYITVSQRNRRDESMTGYRAFRINARKWIIIFTQGRLVNYLLNAYIAAVSLSLVLAPDKHVPWLIFSLLLNGPYVLSYAMLGLLNLGTLLQLDNADFDAVFPFCLKRAADHQVLPITLSADGDQQHENADEDEADRPSNIRAGDSIIQEEALNSTGTAHNTLPSLPKTQIISEN